MQPTRMTRIPAGGSRSPCLALRGSSTRTGPCSTGPCCARLCARAACSARAERSGAGATPSSARRTVIHPASCARRRFKPTTASALAGRIIIIIITASALAPRCRPVSREAASGRTWRARSSARRCSGRGSSANTRSCSLPTRARRAGRVQGAS
ncbi:hypothetical protein T492DRAFT_1056214 [Pavlovales sp. CCMP2436]|nr:hypothetical protein T492DRAFT_1056214 [Pavlovales sp. CCMP2436]